MGQLKQAEQAFPRLKATGYKKTSEKTVQYNCIAWAAGEQHRWWWPDPMRTKYWPTQLPRTESIDVFVQAFELIGYERTADTALEQDYERIALYAFQGLPKHAARQLPNGRWTSKLGGFEDIEHALTGLSGQFYGEPVVIMRRKRSPPAPAPIGPGIAEEPTDQEPAE